MEDFIFGTLSTDAARLNHLTSTRAGITHAHQRSPRDPLPNQAISIDLSIGPTYPYDQGWIYWTNDGSDPEGKNGIPANGYATRPVSYTHLRAHETPEHLVCRLLL